MGSNVSVNTSAWSPAAWIPKGRNVREEEALGGLDLAGSIALGLGGLSVSRLLKWLRPLGGAKWLSLYDEQTRRSPSKANPGCHNDVLGGVNGVEPKW